MSTLDKDMGFIRSLIATGMLQPSQLSQLMISFGRIDEEITRLKALAELSVTDQERLHTIALLEEEREQLLNRVAELSIENAELRAQLGALGSDSSEAAEEAPASKRGKKTTR